MLFRKRKNWDEEFDEGYAKRPARERRGTEQTRYLLHWAIAVLLVGLFLGLAGVVGGAVGFEKTATALFRPLGLVWIGLLLLVYFSLLQRQLVPALMGLGVWLLLTVAGNGWVANQLARSREAAYLDFELSAVDPVDAVVVLGGGTATRLSGDVQLSGSGDRIATASRLFHQQKTGTIVCTGSQPIRISPDDLPPREEAARLLEEMGIPPAQLEQLQGNNTQEEMENLRRLLTARPEWKRIGLVSSAWHLPRAERLLGNVPVVVVPIPSDFRSGFWIPTPAELVPQADSLETTQLIVKEILADWIGR